MIFSGSAAAQNFNQFIAFGISTIDSGWYKNALPGNATGNPATDALITNAIAAGANGAPVGAGNQMNSQLLASYFGLLANPANQAGGTNYAISGARDARYLGSGNNDPNPNLASTAEQITNYLTSIGGHANPNALFMLSTGGNDVIYAQIHFATLADQQTFLANQVSQLVTAVQSLQAAGARYIIVPNLYGFGTLNDFHNQILWSSLANAGVNFIPSDMQTVRRTVVANPTAFGFTAETVRPGILGVGTGSACVWTGAGPTVGWGRWCAPTTTPSVLYAYLRSANSQQTSYYSDDQHFSAAGQKIEADYNYSLLLAPSQISFLAEASVKSRLGLVNTIQNQLPLSDSQRGSAGYNGWVSGDVSWLKANNYNGFPGDPGTPLALTAGFDFKRNGWLFGAAFGVGTSTQSYTDNRGNFKYTEGSVSLYAAYLTGPLWLNAVASYSYLHFDVNRNVPVGISMQNNNANSNGNNISLVGEAGYKFVNGAFSHGLVVGMILQRINVNGFTEGGSFTALSFGSQTRNSAVSELGYQVAYDLGRKWRPFAKLAWNHELASTDRLVTASLTTIAAPSFSLPAVVLGKDWGTGTIGTQVKLSEHMRGYAAFTSQFAQNSTTVYAGQVGVNIGF